MTTKNKPGKGSKAAKAKPAKKPTPAAGRTTRKVQKAKAEKQRKERQVKTASMMAPSELAKARKPRKPRSDKGTKVAKGGVAAPRVPEHKPREELAPHPIDVVCELSKRLGTPVPPAFKRDAKAMFDGGGAVAFEISSKGARKIDAARNEVRVVNAIDPESARRFLESAEGKQTILAVLNREGINRPAPESAPEPIRDTIVYPTGPVDAVVGYKYPADVAVLFPSVEQAANGLRRLGAAAAQVEHNEHLDGDDDGLGAARGLMWALAISACVGFAGWAAWEVYHLAKLAGWF